MAWNGSGGYSKKPIKVVGGGRKSSGILFKGLLAGGIVIVGGLAALLLMTGNETPAPEEPAPEKPNRVKTVQESTPPVVRAVTEVVEPEPESNKNVRVYGHSSNVPSSDTNRIHKATMDGIKVIGADGQEYSVRSQPIFKNRVDNMLWAAIRPGGMPSGLNAIRNRMRHQTGSDAAFLTALKNLSDISADPNDPPHVQTAKEMTVEIKGRIVEEMEKGRSFDDIYQEIQETTYKERMYERITQEDMRKMIKAGDAAAIRRYVSEMNPVLESKGLKQLRVPSWAQEEEVPQE